MSAPQDGAARQATVVLVLVALLLGGVAYWRTRRATPLRNGHATGTVFFPITRTTALATSDSHVLGVASAPIKAIEFSDFQCPFCARFSAVLDSFRTEHHDSIGVIYRNFPLSTIHPMAFAAAMAAECAGAQGRFAPMAHVLFAHQRDFGIVGWMAFANLAGIRDSTGFRRCVRDSSFASTIDRDIKAGVAAGVVGTPNLILGHTRIQGAVSLRVLDSVLRANRAVKPSTGRR
ncbi:MAG TPA: thioredoxin domain-containing protein [Gemmatimonadaceae bacterium]|nr:thioredoxin domain-containing protein [Gemmatimonadaceae bacterium]